MAYVVKEIYYTLQGEGVHCGRPAVFCRFAGCNLWSGHEADRATAVCRFCDTDFVGTDGPGGGRFESACRLADAVVAAWPAAPDTAFVVCTGGEPALQMDPALVEAFHTAGCTVAIETNGTVPLPAGIDWVCVSPKAGTDIVVTAGDEMKLVFPQEAISPSDVEWMAFSHFLLQPMDGPQLDRHTRLAVEYCLSHPRWRLSVQTHKILGLA